jgi:hypothetical protein
MSPYGENAAEDDGSEVQKPQSSEESMIRKDLTPDEIKRLDNKQVDIHQLASERRNFREQADRELNQMVISTQTRGPLINLKEYGDFNRELDKTKSPQRTKDILERIRKMAQDKERDKNTAAAENEEQDPENPELLKLQAQFNKICEDNKHLIGSKQLEGFKAWFEQERQKTPTIAHLKEQIKRLEGKDITDKNGLAPRREEYNALEKLFKRFDLGKPTDNAYLEREGLSERTQFRKNADKMLEHLEHRKDLGFYSPEAIKALMQETLKANTPEAQNKLMNSAESIARKESTSFTHLESKMNVSGKSILKMSQSSKKLYMDYYKNTGLKERGELVDQWKELVDNEAELATQLQGIYKDDVKGLHLALEKFQTLNFMQKQGELKRQKELVKTSTDKDTLHKKLLLDAADAKINEAMGEKVISKKTAEKYQKLFKDPNNYKNPDTKKPGDVHALEKMYDVLKSPVPQEGRENRNLAAYSKRRNEFKKDLVALQLLKPKMKGEEIDKKQDKYDKEGWSKRTLTHKALKEEIAKEKLKAEKIRAKEGNADIDKADKKETKETPLEKSKVEAAAILHMSEDNPRAALKLLMLYDEKNPDDKQILFMIEMAAKQMRELGSKNKGETKFEKQIEEELVESSKGEVVKRDLEEAQVVHLNIEGAKQSEERHEKKKMGQERAKDESMTRASGDSIEAELTEAYYEQTDDKHILNKQGTGEEMTKIKLDTVRFTDEQRHAAKLKTYRNQDRLTHKEGLLSQFSDRTGRILTAVEAKTLHEKKLDQITDTLAERAKARVETKAAGASPIKGILDMQQTIAAKRKARGFVDKKINARIREAA